VIVSQKVLWPVVLSAAIGVALVVVGEIAKDPELRAVGLGFLGAGGFGGGVGYRVPHTPERARRREVDRPS
jgi:hypothetical protein